MPDDIRFPVEELRFPANRGERKVNELVRSFNALVEAQDEQAKEQADRIAFLERLLAEPRVQIPIDRQEKHVGRVVIACNECQSAGPTFQKIRHASNCSHYRP